MDLTSESESKIGKNKAADGKYSRNVT